MHILPLPLCGLYSVRAQNGYGPHRPCKIVLLTLVAPKGVIDLYFSWGINVEHARTAYHKTCGTEYQQPYRRFKSQTPKDRTTNEIRHKRAQWACLTYHAACKVEFQPPIGRTHSWRFSINTPEYMYAVRTCCVSHVPGNHSACCVCISVCLPLPAACML